MTTPYEALLDQAVADMRKRLAGEMAKLKAPIRAEAFEDAARELLAIRGAPEAERAYKAGAEILRLCAVRERAGARPIYQYLVAHGQWETIVESATVTENQDGSIIVMDPKRGHLLGHLKRGEWRRT